MPEVQGASKVRNDGNKAMMDERSRSIRGLILCAVVLLAGLAAFYWGFLGARTFLWEDLLFYAYPGANFFSNALQEGRFPLWISGMHNGLPFYTNLNLTAFYPPLWLLAWIVPNGHVSVQSFQVYLIAQLFLGGIFSYLLFRELKCHVVAACAGMVVFVFSAFMSLHIIHSNVITAFLWLPLQLLFVNRIAGCRPAFWNFMGLIAATLMSFFAGFPQVVMYNSYFVGAYWLYLVVVRRPVPRDNRITALGGLVFREGFKIGLVFLVVILLGACQFYPVAENWSHSSREQYNYRQITDESLPWHYLIHGLAPNFFGMSSGSGEGVPFWGYDKNSLGYATWHAGAWNYWEFGYYAGQLALIALIIFLFNFRRLWGHSREAAFFLLAMPVIFLLMLGCYGGLFKVFYHLVPGFSLFRAPARIGCLLDCCLAFNAAMLVDIVLRGRLVLNLRRPLIALIAIYGVLLAGVFMYGATVFPELKTPVLWGHSVKQVVVSLLYCGAIFAIIRTVAVTQLRWLKVAGAWALVVLTFLELYVAFQPFHGSKANPDDYYSDRKGLIGQLTQMREQAGPFRFAQMRDGVLSEEIVFPRNTGYLYPGYEALEGYVLFNLKDWCALNAVTNQRARLDLQNVGVIANAERATGRVSLMQYTNALPRVKFYHQVRAYADPKSLYSDLDAGRMDYRQTVGIMQDDCVKYGIRTGAPPAQAQVRLVIKNPDEYQVSYQTTAPGVIFISESFYPGWQAEGGRYPVIKAFGALKGIVISEAGSGVITVKFSPATLRMGLVISGATLLGLIIVWVWLGRKREG